MEISPRSPAAAADQPATIFVALELSRGSWVVAVHTPLADKIGRHKLEGGDSEGLLALIARLRARVPAVLGRPVAVVSCYEAGYDGFWLQRLLQAHGVRNHVLDPAMCSIRPACWSIAGPGGPSLSSGRRSRTRGTDRIDAASLLRALMAHLRGEPKVVSPRVRPQAGPRTGVVRVPSVAEEDARRLHRERHRLVGERTQPVNRIKGLLATQGIYDHEPLRRDRRARRAALRTGDNGALPPRLAAEIGRGLTRLELVLEMLAEIEAERDALAAGQARGHPHADKLARLTAFKGIGPELATVLTGEVFYRDFAKRRQRAAYVGLDARPWRSGAMCRDQGIAKAGNPKARTTMPVLGPARPDPWGRARLEVVAPSAKQRLEPLVPRARRRSQGPAAADRHPRVKPEDRIGAQAAGGLVALRRNRPGARRRHAQSLS